MIGACILMTANETRDLMWMGSAHPYKTIAKFTMHSIVTDTRQVAITMNTNCSTLVANLFLFCYERNF